ncbi:MAG: hypothetical protein Roseis2KO_08160 [Roseivirga sp.]
MFGQKTEANAQDGYKYQLIDNGNYSYSVQVVPNVSSNTFPTVVKKYQFTITLPPGVTLTITDARVLNPNVLFFPGAAINKPDDFHIMTREFAPPTSISAPADNTPDHLVTFTVNGSPTSGSIKLISNPEALSAGFKSILQADTIDNGVAEYAEVVPANAVSVTGTSEYFFTPGDNTAPTFDAAPAASSITTGGFTVDASIDESGDIYYVVLANGATAPTSAEVLAGTGNAGAQAVAAGSGTNLTDPFTIAAAVTGLSNGTNYDLYVVARDDEGNPNVQASPTKVDVKTLNTAPTFTSAAVTSVLDNQTYSYTPTATDADNDALTFSATTKPSWLSFNTAGVTTLAGNGSNGDVDGTGTAAQFTTIGGMVVDAQGNIFVADQANYKIKKINSEGVVSTFAGSGVSQSTDGTGTGASFEYMFALAIDNNDNLYAAERHRIRKITPSAVVTTIAGSGNDAYTDGTGTNADLGAIFGTMAVDQNNNVFFGQFVGHVIRKMTPGGVVTTIAGSGTAASTDGTGTSSAEFNFPREMVIDASGNLYVTENAGRIRKITPVGGEYVVSTLAGNGTNALQNGTGTGASFSFINGLTIDASNNLYVTDGTNDVIRKITPEGVVTTFLGQAGVGGFDNGALNTATFNAPGALTFDKEGNLLIADQNKNSIRKVSLKTALTGNAAGQIGNHNVTLKVDDGNGGTAEQSFVVAVTAANAAPVVDLNGATAGLNTALNYDENAYINIAPGGTVSDSDNDNITSMTVTITNATQSFDDFQVDMDFQATAAKTAATNAGVTIGTMSNGVMNITGSATAQIYQDILQNLKYSNSSDVPPAETININVVVNDGTENSTTAISALTIIPFNDGSSAFGTGANPTFTEGGVAVTLFTNMTGHTQEPNETITGFKFTVTNVTDNSGTDEQLIVDGTAITLNNGNSGITSGNSLSYTVVLAGSTATVSLSGGTFTASAFATLTEGLKYENINQNPSSANRVVTLSEVTDSGAQGAGHDNPWATSHATSNVMVSPVNDPSVFTSATTANFAENGTGTAYTITATDVESNNLTYTLGTGNDTDKFNINGPVVTFKTAPDFENPTDGDGNNTYIVEVKVTENGVTVMQNVTITVTDVNENVAPTFTSIPVTSVPENQIYNYELTGADNNNDFLTFTTTSKPSWLSLVTEYEGEVTTFAGSGFGTQQDGTGTSATFTSPKSIATDAAGNIYVAESGIGGTPLIRKVSPEGVVVTIAGGASGYVDGTGTDAGFIRPFGIAVDAFGNIFVSDLGNTNANTIRKITPDGVVSTFAGSAGFSGNTDNYGTSATFTSPKGLAFDGSGNLFVADGFNIRKIATDGLVTTVAGNGSAGSAEGTGTSASFNQPTDIAIDESDNLYVSDYVNNKIRKITPAGIVSTFVGTGAQGADDGPGTSATFYFPFGLTFDNSGNLYVADWANEKIRKVTPNRVVSTFAGSGTTGTQDGIGTSASFNYPDGIAFNIDNAIYVGDDGNHLLRRVSLGSTKLTGIPSSMQIGDHNVRLKVDDGNGGITEQAFTITVSDNTDPSFTSATAVNFSENGTGTAYSIAATDSNPITYSLGSGNDESLFDINGGVVTFKNAPDFENPVDANTDNTYMINVIATDASNNTANQNVTITVTDVDDTAPVFTSLTTASFAENGIGTAYTVEATDASTITYSLGTGNDESLFNITGGVITFKTDPDFESPSDGNTDNAYVINVIATDAASNASNQDVTITVTNVDDSAPVISSATVVDFAENTTGVAYTIVATDENNISYSLGTGNDGASFSLNGAEVSFNNSPDFETKAIYVINVIATDAVGNVATQNVTIRVTDVDEVSPTVDITTEEGDPGNSSSFEIQLTFSEGVKSTLSGTLTFEEAEPNDSPTEAGAFSLTETSTISGTAGGTDIDIWVLGQVSGEIIFQSNLGGGDLKFEVFKYSNDQYTDGTFVTANNAATGSFEGDGIHYYAIQISEPRVAPRPYDMWVGGEGLNSSGALSPELFTLTNATVSNILAISPSSYTADLTPLADGAVSVSLAAGVVQDEAGNDLIASEALTLTHDKTSPALTISTEEPNITNSTSFEILVSSSEFVGGGSVTFTDVNESGSNESYNDSGIITVSSPSILRGSIGRPRGGRGTDDLIDYWYLGNIVGEVEIESQASSSVSIIAQENVATSPTTLASGTGSTTFSFTADGSSEYGIAVTGSNLRSTLSYEIRVTGRAFGVRNGLSTESFTLTNATLDNFVEGDNNTFTANVTPLAEGIVEVSLAADVVEDTAENGNSASNTLTLTYDGTDPAITSATAVNFAENGTGTAYTVVATDANPVTYSLGTGNDEALFNISGGIVTFINAPDFEQPGDGDTNNTYVINVIATDVADNSIDQEVTVTVTDVQENIAPVVDLDGATSGFINENGSIGIADYATITDADNDNIVSMTVTVTGYTGTNTDQYLGINGATNTIATNAGVTVSAYDANTGTLSVTGSATAAIYQSILRGIAYGNNSDNPPAGDVVIHIEVNDGTVKSSDVTNTITITPVNDEPVFTSQAITSVNEGAAYTYNFAATDADGDVLTFTTPTVPGWLSLVNTPAGIGSAVSTLAGNGTAGNQNGTGTNAILDTPVSFTIDANGNLYTLTKSGEIKKITPQGVVSTFLSQAVSGITDTSPSQMGTDSNGNIYYSVKDVIIKVTPQGVSSTFASDPRFNPEFNNPEVLIILGANYFVIDNNDVMYLRGLFGFSKIDLNTNQVTDIFANGSPSMPERVGMDNQGNIIFTLIDLAGVANTTIQKLNGDNSLTLLLDLGAPTIIDDLVFDASGNMIFVDKTANLVKTYNATDGIVTLAGGAGQSLIDGTGTSAGFNKPISVEIDNSQNLYVLDVLNHAIRKIEASAGQQYLSGTAPSTAGTHNVVLKADDNNGGTAEQSFTVTVNDVTDPVFTSGTAVNFAENGTGTAYTVGATDANALTYSLGTGNDEDLFAINGGTVTFKTSPDFEVPTDGNTDNAYLINVIASDGANSVNQDVTITVTDVNDVSPVISSATSVNYAENGQGAAYSVTATDVDSQNLTYSLGTGNDESLFDITAGVVTFKTSPDYESASDGNTDNAYVIEVQANDGLNMATQTVTITVTDVDEIDPVFTSATAVNFAENGTGTAYAIVATDVNAVTYALGTGNDEGLFDISGGVVTFKAAPDFEVPADANTDNEYVIEVQANDGLNTATQTVTITVTDVDEIDPVFTSATAVNFVENGTGTVYAIVATDANAVTYALGTGNDEGLFDISGGVVTFKAAPDFEAPADANTDNAYVIEVQANDGLNTATQTVTITVTDVDEIDPVFTSATAVNFAENGMGTAYTIAATDANAVTYSIATTKDYDKFNVVDGVVTFVSAPDFETPGDADGQNTYEIDVNATDGLNTATQTVVITVTDIDEIKPAIVSLTPTVGTKAGVGLTELKAVFDEPVVKGGGGGSQVIIRKTSDNSVVESILISSSQVVVSGSEVTITPSVELPLDEELLVFLTASALSDGNGNNIQGVFIDTRWTFTIGDITSPSIVSLTPTAGGVAGEGITELKALFNEPVVKGSGGGSRAIIRRLSDNVIIESILMESSQVSVSGAEVTISPSAELPLDEELLVFLTASAVTDMSGNDIQGVFIDTRWTFTIADITSPSIVSLTPTVGSNITDDLTELKALFNEPMVKGSGGGSRAIIRRLSDNVIIESILMESSQVSVSGAEVTITPSVELPFNEGFLVFLTASAVTDMSGNDIQGVFIDTRWTFTLTDDSAPVFTSLTSVDYVENTSVTAYTVAATDNAAITYSLGSGSDESLFDINGSTGEVTFKSVPDFEDPQDGNADNTYVISVIATDANSNSENQDVTITVTDIDEIKPAIISLTPTVGTKAGVGLTELKAVFDEPVVKGSGGGSQVIIRKTSDNSVVESILISSLQVVVSGSEVTITPSVELPLDEELLVFLTASALSDGNGNNIQGVFIDTRWTFTIGDITSPSIVSLTPTAGGVAGEGITELKALFDEPVVKGSGGGSRAIIRRLSDNVIIESILMESGQVSVSGSEVTITPSVELPLDEELLVFLTASAVTDMSGNDIQGVFIDTRWTFTIPDTTSPSIVSLTPTVGSNNTDELTELKALFNEPVVKGSGGGSRAIIRRLSDNVIIESILMESSQVSVSGSEVTITPSVELPLDEELLVFLTASAVTDMSGNNIQGVFIDTRWTFTVISTPGNVVSQENASDIIPIEIVEEAKPAGIIRAYPNPTAGVFNLTFEHPERVKGFVIYDLLGIKVLGKSSNIQAVEKIDLSNLPEGVYLISIAQQGVSRHIKVVVKK